jgi:hypothetical protein
MPNHTLRFAPLHPFASPFSSVSDLLNSLCTNIRHFLPIWRLWSLGITVKWELWSNGKYG